MSDLHVLIDGVGIRLSALPEAVDVGFAIENGIQHRIPVEQLVLVRVVVIEPPICLVSRLPISQPVIEVVFNPRQIGSPEDEIVIDLRRDRVPAAGRNDVPYKRGGCDDLTFRVELPGEWIVQLPPGVPSGVPRMRRIVEFGKVATIHLFSRHGEEPGAARAEVRTLIVAEKEKLVLADRPTQCAAKLVSLKRSPCDIEEVSRIGLFISQKLEYSATVFVGSRFGHHVDYRAP